MGKVGRRTTDRIYFFANRKGKQFLLYKQILKFGMYNLRKKESGFGTGNRGKLDLFE